MQIRRVVVMLYFSGDDDGRKGSREEGWLVDGVRDNYEQRMIMEWGNATPRMKWGEGEYRGGFMERQEIYGRSYKVVAVVCLFQLNMMF